MVVKSSIFLQNICKIIPGKRCYHQYKKAILLNVYKQYYGVKRKQSKIKLLQLYQGFQLQFRQERVDKGKKIKLPK